MTRNTKIVLIVVGVCCTFGLTLLLILAALVIPATQSVIRHGNETSAVNSLRLLNTEEQTYNLDYPQRGFACSLSVMGGSPQTGPATADAAQLIPDDLAGGHKAGYTFTITDCTNVAVKGHNQVTSYELTAVPITPGHSGNRGFCMDETGTIKFDPRGGTNCTEPLQ